MSLCLVCVYFCSILYFCWRFQCDFVYSSQLVIQKNPLFVLRFVLGKTHCLINPLNLFSSPCSPDFWIIHFTMYCIHVYKLRVFWIKVYLTLTLHCLLVWLLEFGESIGYSNEKSKSQPMTHEWFYFRPNSLNCTKLLLMRPKKLKLTTILMFSGAHTYFLSFHSKMKIEKPNNCWNNTMNTETAVIRLPVEH